MMNTWILQLIGLLCNTLLFNTPVTAQGTSSRPASPTTELTTLPIIMPPVTIGCETNDDCSIDNRCINKLCIDECSLGICGDNADCLIIQHRLLCICPPGTTGDPYDGCTAFTMTTEHVDRPTSLLTTPYTTPQTPQNIIACESNDQCPNENLCLNHLCMDACHTGHCVKNVNCQAGGHRPSCICIPGTPDNLKVKCIALSSATSMPQPPIAGQPPFIITDSLIIPESKPPPIMPPPPQTTRRPPPPLIMPPVLGCRSDYDCHIDNSCINQSCIDGCSLGICGDDADCQTVNHRPVCTCPYGTTGNPEIGCKVLTMTTEHVDHPTSLLSTPCYCL